MPSGGFITRASGTSCSVPEYIVRWHQEDPAQVDAWEFQFSQTGNEWRWVISVDPVEGCVDCFEARILADAEVSYVRSRSIGPGGISEWSKPIALPEPTTSAQLVIGVLWLLLIAHALKRLR